jgi:proteasome lid subunit RPN8/RPN11
MSYVPSSDVIKSALALAGRYQPMESCGVVVADGSFVPIPNLALEPGHFIMDARHFCRIDTQHSVKAIIHSHIEYPPIASDVDRVMCEKSGLPWVIVTWPDGHWNVIEPTGYQAPLVGREWIWGSHDCYGLIRDGFYVYTGIQLPDYSRDWLFWRRGEDIVSSRISPNGFVEMPHGTQPRHCDILGMAINSKVINHLALFLEPDHILHQLYRKLSVSELYSGLWYENTKLHLRHERFI